eukprot:jgi/Ulvmu1/1992/UM012_0154.1
MAWFEDIVFFTVAVGFTMPWAALSSELGYLKMIHGPNFFLYLNIAYFLPSAPILLLQLALDQHYNRIFGTAISTLARQGLAQIVCAVSCLVLPFLPWTNFKTMLALAAIIGTVNSTAFGSSNQLVARFPAECGQALALGIVASGALVLMPQALLRLGAHPTHSQQLAFFLIAALYSVAAAAAMVALVRKHWSELQSGSSCTCGHALDEADSAEASSAIDANLLESSALHGEQAPEDHTAQQAAVRPDMSADEGDRQPLLPHGNHPPAGGASAGHGGSWATSRKADHMHASDATGSPEVGEGDSGDDGKPWEAVRAVAPLAASLGSSVGVSVMLFPLFTVVRSSGVLGCMLPQALFAARMLADILSRVAARVYVPPRSVLQVLAAVKFASLAAAVAYLWAPQALLSDTAAVGFVAGHWTLSGLVGAWSYMLVPRALPRRGASQHAGNVMSAAFQASQLVGLLGAALLEYSVHASGVGDDRGR